MRKSCIGEVHGRDGLISNDGEYYLKKMGKEVIPKCIDMSMRITLEYSGRQKIGTFGEDFQVGNIRR